uniref:Uncharacterized protein n=1 Tax=Candidatus Magnetobacterium bavaricum TaxID=29290 RepID=D7GXE3_9BACT|nr:hypothetical protein mtbajb2F00022 [Candidatus Magnetobacterium bavaricum]
MYPKLYLTSPSTPLPPYTPTTSTPNTIYKGGLPQQTVLLHMLTHAPTKGPHPTGRGRCIRRKERGYGFLALQGVSQPPGHLPAPFRPHL